MALDEAHEMLINKDGLVRTTTSAIGKQAHYLPYREEILKTFKSQVLTPAVSRKRKLVDLLCKTRWVARHDALVTFSSLYPAVVFSHNDGGGWNASSSTAAASLLNCVTQFQFIVAFTTVSKVMSHIQALSVALQERAIDIVKAYSLVSRVMDRLKELRQKVDDTHLQWWKDVEAMARELDVPECMPRQCSRQVHRNQAPATSVADYYKRNVTIPFLDEVIGQMETRFGPLQQLAVSGLSLFPAAMMKEQTPKASLMKFGKAHVSDFPPGCNMDTFEADKESPAFHHGARPLEWFVDDAHSLLQKSGLRCCHSALCCTEPEEDCSS